VPAGSAKEICAARAGRGCASLLAKMPRSFAERPGAEKERVAPEVVETEEARDQRNVRHAGMYIRVLERACPRCECQLECAWVVVGWLVIGNWEGGGRTAVVVDGDG
jgi:hypothetical protein